MDNSGLVGVRHVMATPRVGERGQVTCFPLVVSWRETFAELEATTHVGCGGGREFFFFFFGFWLLAFGGAKL